LGPFVLAIDDLLAAKWFGGNEIDQKIVKAFKAVCTNSSMTSKKLPDPHISDNDNSSLEVKLARKPHMLSAKLLLN